MNENLAASAAIRSPNADFVRKGIVISADDGCDSSRGLDPKILKLVDALKGPCKAAGTKDLSDISSAIQLWKERSLHHTLQTLDPTRNDTIKSGSRDRQIEAIELHDRAGREIKDAVARVVQNIINTIVQQIEGFSVELAVVLREMLRPELEEELLKERGITERLVLERQKLMKEQITLQDTNAQLKERIDNWENAADGGGDATLCRKLREQLRQLKQQRQDEAHKMAQMQKDHEQWRLEMTKMKTDLEMAYKTLAMTRAMHDKETKHLLDLIHAKQSHFDRVRQATSSAKAVSIDAQPPKSVVTTHDPHSGRTICYINAPSPTTRSSRPVLACLTPQHPLTASPSKTSVGKSPQKRRLVSSAPPQLFNNNS